MVASSDLLLRSKTQMPRLRQARLAREQLQARLEWLPGCRLILICAPAGFGKTTLLVGWVEAAAFPTAWLTLDEGDNSLERLLRYLVAAFQRILPEIGGNALAMLAAPQPLQAEAFLDYLITDLEALPGPVGLVLDDYHALQNPAAREALAYLVNHLPEGLHLAIASRTDPALPLARMRARGELVELRGPDLRFNPEEASWFLNHLMGLRLTPSQVEDLVKRTEGWAAGLQLAAISIRQSPDPQTFIKVFAGSHRYILDYLVEEVLRQQPKEVQDFLLKTSILERLCGSLCEAVIEGQEPSSESREDRLPTPLDPSELLQELDRTNLFIIPLDDERTWYRYHTLFRELLSYQLEQAYSREVILDLHHRAGAWFTNKGMLPEAIHHAIAAGEIRQAGELAEQYGGSLLSQGLANTCLGWLDRLPEPVYTAFPRLHLVYANGMLSTGQFDRIEDRLQAAENALKGIPTDNLEARSIRAEINGSRSIIASLRGDLPRVIELSTLALEDLPENAFLRSSLLMGLGVAYRLSGDTRQAEATFAQSAQEAQKVGLSSVMVTALGNRASCFQEMGQLKQAERVYLQALDEATQEGTIASPQASLACAGLASLACDRNDLTAAQTWLDQAATLDEAWGNLDMRVYNLIHRVRLSMIRGEKEAALQALADAETLGKGCYLSPTSVIGLGTLSAWIAIQMGDSAKAREWLKTHPDPAGGSEATLSEPVALIWAEVQLMLGREEGNPGRMQAALDVLSHVESVSRTAGRLGYTVQATVLEALVLDALGKPDDAYQALTQAIETAGREEWISLFTERGEPMADLLRRAAAGGTRLPAPTGYLERVMAGFRFEPAASAGEEKTKQGASPLLSERETEVLQLVAQGYSNQRIAEQLVLTTGTVKRHLHNIFEKLGVTSRTEAIARARILGIGA